MLKILYYFGRLLQIIGLIALPFSLWVGFIGHNERGSMIIFFGSVFIFLIGWMISQIRTFYES